MVDKMQNESAKLTKLSKEDCLQFLLKNNCDIDEKTYNYFKQMILSQLHFDESISALFSFYIGRSPIGNNILITKDQKIKYMTENDWFNYNNSAFFAMLNDIKKGDFSSLKPFLEFIDENYEEKFTYSEEENAYFEKVGNGVNYQGFNILEDKSKKYIDEIYKNIKIYNEIEKYENNKRELENKINESQKKLAEIKSKRGLPIIRNIKLKITKDQKLAELKYEEKIILEDINNFKEKLNKLKIKNEQNMQNKPDINIVKKEMIDIFKDLKTLCNSTYYRMKAEELILFVQNEPDLEKNMHYIIPRVHDIISNIHNGMEFKFYCRQLLDEIEGQVKFTASIYSTKNMESNDLISLVSNLRSDMKNNQVSSNIGISLDYRNKSLGKSNYIKGTNLNYEQITEAMNELNNEYLKIKDSDNVEEYVRACADLFQKFLMIHPYTDGNGRTARALITALLAKKNIFIPGIYDSYIERDSNSMFMVFGDVAALNNNYRLFEDYILARVQKYNPDLIKGNFSYLNEAYEQILSGNNNMSIDENVMKL